MISVPQPRGDPVGDDDINGVVASGHQQEGDPCNGIDPGHPMNDVKLSGGVCKNRKKIREIILTILERVKLISRESNFVCLYNEN